MTDIRALPFDRELSAGARNAVRTCLRIEPQEKVTLITDHACLEIAASLAISARTVEFHKYQMMETLDLHTNAELIHFAIKQGLVEF